MAAVSGYDTAHDDFDYTQVTSNPSLLKEYNHCYLETGPCNEIASFFKRKSLIHIFHLGLLPTTLLSSFVKFLRVLLMYVTYYTRCS